MTDPLLVTKIYEEMLWKCLLVTNGIHDMYHRGLLDVAKSSINELDDLLFMIGCMPI